MKQSKEMETSAVSKFISMENLLTSLFSESAGRIPYNDIRNLALTAYPYVVECKKGTIEYDHECLRNLVNQFTDNPVVQKDLWRIITMYCFENAIHKAITDHASELAKKDYNSLFNFCTFTVSQAAEKYDPSDGSFINYVFRSLENNIKAENRDALKGTNLGAGNSAHQAKRNAIIADDLAKQANTSAEDLAKLIYADDLAKVSPEKYAKALARKAKSVEKVRSSISSQVVSLNTPVGEDGDEFGSFIADTSDVCEEYQQQEQENTLLTKFIPIIADIYGDDCAYVALLRTGILWGFEKISFYKMENLYSQYLVTVKKLNQLAEEVPSYAEICAALKRAYAVSGKHGYVQYIKGLPEEYLFRNLIVEADKEAKIIADGDRKSSECFKPAGSLNYMFSKVFPIKGTNFSDRDKKNAARFRKELRDIGMDEIANRLFAMFSSAE